MPEMNIVGFFIAGEGRKGKIGIRTIQDKFGITKWNNPKEWKQVLETIRKDNDPLVIFRQKVEEAGLVESSDLDVIDDDLMSQVTNAVEKAKNSPLPNVEELTTNVYEEGSY